MRSPIGTVAIAVALLIAAPGAAAAPKAPIKISRTGQIGALRLHVSTAARVRKVWGRPQSVLRTRGNNLLSRWGDDSLRAGGFGIKNTRLGYDCHREDGFPICVTSFCISDRTHRLESFVTTSSAFTLFGGVHVGMRARLAAKREHAVITHVSEPGFTMVTKHLVVVVSTHGGRVAGISIDHRPGGVGVTDA